MEVEPKSVPIWRKAMPFAIGSAFVAFVLLRLDMDAFVAALERTNFPAFVAFTFAFAVSLLLTDSMATAHVYRKLVGPVSFRDYLTIRGASYLPSLINHHVGQAWITYYASKVYKAPLWRVAGATLVVYATVLGMVVAFSTLGLVLAPGRFSWLPYVIGALLIAAALYMLVLKSFPEFLRKRQVTAALADLGVAGHLSAFLWRIPHVCVLFVGSWIPFQFFGVSIPIEDAFTVVPPLMIIVALPLTPQGVGTRDAFAATVFAVYVSESAGDAAAVLAAATLSWAVLLSLVQIPISMLLLRPAQKLLEKAEEQEPKAL